MRMVPFSFTGDEMETVIFATAVLEVASVTVNEYLLAAAHEVVNVVPVPAVVIAPGALQVYGASPPVTENI